MNLNLKDSLDAIGVFLVTALTALGAFLWKRSRAAALQTEARASAHVQHSQADRLELEARGSLDESTREWADNLIRWHNDELQTLRAEIRDMRTAHTQERREYEARNQARFEKMQAEIDALRAANLHLSAENERLNARLRTMRESKL